MAVKVFQLRDKEGYTVRFTVLSDTCVQEEDFYPGMISSGWPVNRTTDTARAKWKSLIEMGFERV